MPSGKMALLAVLLWLTAPAGAQAQQRVWMYPSGYRDGASWKALFDDPDGWRQTRRHITGIGYADHVLNKQFTDAQLRAWLPQIARWGLKLGLEVGAVKPASTTGQRAFEMVHARLDRFIADGARIDHIAMDEPYAATVQFLHMPAQYGIEQTAIFVALMRRAYPGLSIGDIEPYPGFQPAQIMAWIDGVQARLRQMGVKPLDFLRLDVDWMHFHPGDQKGQLGWRGTRMIEDACHRRGMAFSLIYWAANYPSLRHDNRQSGSTWTDAILDETARYKATGGVPDEAVVESWLMSERETVPDEVTPETDSRTLTGSVLALESQFSQTRQ